jgi:hypothetical protein
VAVGWVRGLTFEVTGVRRQDALARLAKMHRVPPTGPRWLAVARPVDQGVRPHSVIAEPDGLDEEIRAPSLSTVGKSTGTAN